MNSEAAGGGGQISIGLFPQNGAPQRAENREIQTGYKAGRAIITVKTAIIAGRMG